LGSGDYGDQQRAADDGDLDEHPIDGQRRRQQPRQDGAGQDLAHAGRRASGQRSTDNRESDQQDPRPAQGAGHC